MVATGWKVEPGWVLKKLGGTQTFFRSYGPFTARSSRGERIRLELALLQWQPETSRHQPHARQYS